MKHLNKYFLRFLKENNINYYGNQQYTQNLYKSKKLWKNTYRKKFKLNAEKYLKAFDAYVEIYYFINFLHQENWYKNYFDYLNDDIHIKYRTRLFSNEKINKIVENTKDNKLKLFILVYSYYLISPFSLINWNCTTENLSFFWELRNKYENFRNKKFVSK